MLFGVHTGLVIRWSFNAIAYHFMTEITWCLSIIHYMTGKRNTEVINYYNGKRYEKYT
jgi:hypothetical protein